MGEIHKLPTKCPKCKRQIKKPNKLNKMPIGYPVCSICIEEETHKQIMERLEGARGPLFCCGIEGCNVIDPTRDCLKYYSADQLFDEIKSRISGECDD
ncbi:MAG TPA: hypothetical protein DD789_03050 [Firmicutes bacterium]|jgi:hypothetical protein|nr:hypothetical protein [Bacillota bacterium]